MESKAIIIAVTCISLLMSQAFASVTLLKAAENAIGGSALIKTGLMMKGKAAVLGLKGLAGLSLKGIAAKGALLAKGIALGKKVIMSAASIGSGLLNPPATTSTTTSTAAPCCNPCDNAVTPSDTPSILDILRGTWNIVQNKKHIAGRMLDELTDEEVILARSPVVYEYVESPRIYTVPVAEEIQLGY